MARLIEEMANTSDALAGIDDLTEVLHRLAARARSLVAADYAAVATFDERRSLTQFIWAGMDDQLAATLGHAPVGRGLLGQLAHADRPIRLVDIRESKQFTGWPELHPDMCAFLGVPVRVLDQTIGSLYMTRTRGGLPFSEADEGAASIMALQIAAVLSTAMAREAARLVAARLAAERARADAILQAIDHGVYEIAPDGTIRSFNHGAERLLRYPEASVLGRDAHSLLHITRSGEASPPQDCPVIEVLETGISYRGDECYRRSDGRYIDVSLSAAAVVIQGGAIDGVVIVFHDVSERAHREQMKDDFFAFAAHEVRSPLATVTGFAQWLQRRATARDATFDVDERDAIESLALESQRVATTIEVFLDLTRIQSERLTVDVADVDVCATVMAEILRLQASNPDVDISLKTPDIPLPARADQDRLRQVIENLLTNAVKYGGSPPTVRVEVAEMLAGVVVSVEDNGPGIAEPDRLHIFERFYRSAGKSTVGKAGLGVGLYIAHEVVMRMGGTLTFQTGPAGTRLVLLLPVH